MSGVLMHAVVSVDGYLADEHDDVGPLFEWYFNGDTDIVEGEPFKISKASAGYVRSMWDSIGSMVIGRAAGGGGAGGLPAARHSL